MSAGPIQNERIAGKQGVCLDLGCARPGLERFGLHPIESGLDGVLAFFLTEEAGTSEPVVRKSSDFYALGIGLSLMSVRTLVDGRIFRNGVYSRYGVSLVQPEQSSEYYIKDRLRVLRLRLTQAGVSAAVEEMGGNSKGFELRDISALADREIGVVCRRLVKMRFEPVADSIETDSLLDRLITRIVVLNGSRELKVKWRESLSPAMFQSVQDFVSAHYTTSIKLADLCRLTGLSRAHFLRAFKYTAGTSPHEFLMQYRLRKASQLVCSTSYSLEQIAQETGFSSHAHLTRRFQAYLSVSPLEVRRHKFRYPDLFPLATM